VLDSLIFQTLCPVILKLAAVVPRYVSISTHMGVVSHY